MGKLGVNQKKWLLALHLIFASIMLGVAVIFLHLSITAATADDESIIMVCYMIMHKLASTAVRVSTFGTIVTGILLSVLTQWGLFKFYWIIAKEVLSLVSILLGPIGMYFWTLKAITIIQGPGAINDLAFVVNSNQLRVGIILQMISLILIFLLSVIKPWGRRNQTKN